MMTRLRTAAKMHASSVSMIEARTDCGIWDARLTMMRDATSSAEIPRMTVGMLRVPTAPALPLFLDAALLADLLPKIIQLRPAYAPLAEDLDLLNAGRVQRERALDADAVRD